MEGLSRVAIYERTIHASLERIWENVLDWEHLPWLHRSSFLGVRLVDESREHWRGWISVPSRKGSADSLIDTRLDRSRLRYLVRTLEGAGAGSEVLTRLEPAGDRETRIAVEFRVPAVAADRAAALGRAYVELYTRLWDEDEGMMSRRQMLLDANGTRRRRVPAAAIDVPLGPVAELRARLPHVIEAAGSRFRLVEEGGEILAHATTCPHRGGPLDAAPIADGCVTCPWHGYRFHVRSRQQVGGSGLEMARAPRVSIDPSTDEASLVWDPPSSKRAPLGATPTLGAP